METNLVSADDSTKGVNTGFGGSADTRTNETDALQRTLIHELHYGVLATPTVAGSQGQNGHVENGYHASSTSTAALLSAEALPNGDPVAATAMPEAWVRASLLVRCNSLASGNSGVRPILIENLVDFLRKDIVPAIPLRGSISASGDLSPLAYIAGALQGSPGTKVWIGDRKTESRRLISADVALSDLSLNPLHLGPKEGLAIVNGTSVSAGTAALALHDAHCLTVLAQVLTAMSVEALRGNVESFDPFFAAVRPHPGQVEASHNIRSFLTGSKLVRPDDVDDDGSLRQDRYSIRTAPQWIGPELENLMLAHKQVVIECNSTTDNPIIDTAGGRVLHGGNFQAMAIASAMERTRSTMQIIGRMLFVQCTELINPALNNGLPPNLVADEPSQSFIMKGIDISIAALQAELGFLSNPVVSHVQTAEMGNQSLNSLALVSARYTHMAVDVLSQLAADCLFALCQALDLRVMHYRFLEALEPAFKELTSEILGKILVQQKDLDRLHTKLWAHLQKELGRTTNMDSIHRFPQIMTSIQLTVMSFEPSEGELPGLMPVLKDWSHRCSLLSLHIFTANRDKYLARPDATPLLGPASRRMYKFVREHLGVPFLCTQQRKPPPPEAAAVSSTGKPILSENDSRGSATLGSMVTTIYTSIRDGALYVPVMECLREACRTDKNHGLWVKE